jgi:IS5 family transposase
MAVSTGTIVDATIIAAPSSTKNATGTRDPEMHQTKKGQQWYFGMKGHFGVDSQSKLIHSVEVTPADIHDSRVLPWLWHGHERRVWGDSAYAGHGTVLGVYAPTLATSFIVGRPRRSCARPIAGSPACAFGSRRRQRSIVSTTRNSARPLIMRA